MFANINPITVGLPAVQADKLRIERVSINTIGNQGSAEVLWSVYSDSVGTIANRSLRLEGVDYAAWGNDDAYLLTWVARQLGVSIASIDPDLKPVTTDG